MNSLVVVATAAEADFLSGLPCRVVVSGVGAVAAALATQRALLSGAFELVISAGIAGAFPQSDLHSGDLAISSQLIQADLGAWDGEQFLTLAQLGLSRLPNEPDLQAFPAWGRAQALAKHLGAAFGPMLTVNAATGNAERLAALQARFPEAITEGMEGAGVAQAAYLAEIPVLELRGISNLVGPRDRATWRIPEALKACRLGLETLLGH